MIDAPDEPYSPVDPCLPVRDWLDGQEFYELMQAYRHARDHGPHGSPAYVVERFEAVKEFVRDKLQDEVCAALESAEMWVSEHD